MNCTEACQANAITQPLLFMYQNMQVFSAEASLCEGSRILSALEGDLRVANILRVSAESFKAFFELSGP